MRNFSERFKFILPNVIARLSSGFHQYFHSSSDVTTPSNIRLQGLEGFLEKVGIHKGSTLMVHSSWEQLNSGNFSVKDLIDSLLKVVGSNGTLAMPAFPPYTSQVSGSVFDVCRTPSAGGLVTEAFRRYPGVVRSINLNHSVCALGPQSDFLTSEHHLSETSWDDLSPYYRLKEIDDAWVIGLGVGHRLKVATSLHCVESKLWKENSYFNKLFAEEVYYSYKAKNGHIGKHCYRKRIGQIYTPKLAKYFTPNELVEEVIDGLEIYAIKAHKLINKAIKLGREGKTMYIWPIPFKRNFSKR